MIPLFETTIPMALPSRPNLERSHWQRQKLVKKQNRSMGSVLVHATPPPLPVIVQLVRISPRMLDGDNLVGSVKACRDSIARWLGSKDDRQYKEIRWVYGWKKDTKRRPGYQALEVKVFAWEPMQLFGKEVFEAVIEVGT